MLALEVAGELGPEASDAAAATDEDHLAGIVHPRCHRSHRRFGSTGERGKLLLQELHLLLEQVQRQVARRTLDRCIGGAMRSGHPVRDRGRCDRGFRSAGHSHCRDCRTRNQLPATG